jgi:hypothetical protein
VGLADDVGGYLDGDADRGAVVPGVDVQVDHRDREIVGNGRPLPVVFAELGDDGGEEVEPLILAYLEVESVEGGESLAEVPRVPRRCS